jgi:5'-nucleotidase
VRTDRGKPELDGHGGGGAGRRRSGDDAAAPKSDIARDQERVERRDVDRERGEPLAQRDRRLAPPRSKPRVAKPLHEWSSRPRILVTNDDGVESRGLLALKQALEPLGDVYVLAPETNQSAVGHTKTFMRPLRVRERTLADGSRGWSVDGSPTDAVSLAFLGYFDVGFDLVASGINYGANLGDDITYSGTVAAALEGIVLGIPAIAISQQSTAREMGFRFGRTFDFGVAAGLAVELVRRVIETPLPDGILLNVNCPAGEPQGIEVARLGKRLYNDELKLVDEDGDGRRRYEIYGFEPSYEDEPGTDLAAVARGRAAITPIHFELTAHEELERLGEWDLQAMLASLETSPVP